MEDRHACTKFLSIAFCSCTFFSIVIFMASLPMCTLFGHPNNLLWYCPLKNHDKINVIGEYVLARSSLTYKLTLDAEKLSGNVSLGQTSFVSNYTTYHQMLVVEDLSGNGCDFEYRNSTILRFDSHPSHVYSAESFGGCGTDIPDQSVLVYLFLIFWSINGILILGVCAACVCERKVPSGYIPVDVV